MKNKLFIFLLVLSGVVFAESHEKPHMGRQWCQQNWEQCKSLKERYILKKRECLQKAESFESYKECMVQVKSQMKRKQSR